MNEIKNDPEKELMSVLDEGYPIEIIVLIEKLVSELHFLADLKSRNVLMKMQTIKEKINKELKDWTMRDLPLSSAVTEFLEKIEDNELYIKKETSCYITTIKDLLTTIKTLSQQNTQEEVPEETTEVEDYEDPKPPKYKLDDEEEESEEDKDIKEMEKIEKERNKK